MTHNRSIGIYGLYFLLITATISLSFILNVVVHELGHYMIADHFGTHPEMHFFDALKNSDGSVGFNIARLNSEPVAYVMFDHPKDPWAFLNIAFAGVLMNLLFAALIVLAFTFIKRTFLSELMFLSFLVPCIVSALINLNVFNPITDGAQIVQTVLSII